jgi:hypothetical protein
VASADEHVSEITANEAFVCGFMPVESMSATGSGTEVTVSSVVATSAFEATGLEASFETASWDSFFKVVVSMFSSTGGLVSMGGAVAATAIFSESGGVSLELAVAATDFFAADGEVLVVGTFVCLVPVFRREAMKERASLRASRGVGCFESSSSAEAVSRRLHPLSVGT